MGIEHLPFTTSPRKPPQLVTTDRERLEALIASAIEMLDLIDGDPDLEDDDPDWEHDGAEEGDDRVHLYGIDQSRPLTGLLMNGARA